MKTPKTCASCVSRLNDALEGQLCTKYDKPIGLSSGAVIEWPGAPVTWALSNRCHGDGYQRGVANWLWNLIGQ